jgi:hypothetical protein
MKPLKTLAAALLITATATPIAHAQQIPSGGMMCGKRLAVLSDLAGRYAEQPKSISLANNGTILEILTSKTGSWTILVTTPKGMSCMMATGEHWENLPVQTAGGIKS